MDIKTKTLRTELYKKVYLIRRAEKGIVDNYASDAMKTPMHMSMGEEAIVGGVCQALKKTDQVLGTYRSHALYLSKTGEVIRFFAEMYGKSTGIADGKSGSMHLSSPKDGYMMSSAIVATTIPVAVGVAYANIYKKTNAVTAVFFGDGAIEGGAFWESLNFAALKDLPVIFVCEDNGYAVQAKPLERHGYASINTIVEQFNCLSYESDSTDPEIIYHLTVKVIAQMRAQKKPAFMHLKYYRYLEHVGVKEDFNLGYRPIEEFKTWKKIDPVTVARKKLIASGVPETKVRAIEKAIDRRVENAITAAAAAPFPKKEKLYKDICNEG